MPRTQVSYRGDYYRAIAAMWLATNAGLWLMYNQMADDADRAVANGEPDMDPLTCRDGAHIVAGVAVVLGAVAIFMWWWMS